MTKSHYQREFFFDSLRAYLMLIGIPFHLSLIYSTHPWTVNSLTPSYLLTVLNDIIHAFRMQVFFIISGYFSYMLYTRYGRKKWLKVRLQRVVIPFLSSILLITFPQFLMIKTFTSKIKNWAQLSILQKVNIMIWELISHLWFLFTLLLLTGACLYLFKKIKNLDAICPPHVVMKILNFKNIAIIFLIYGAIYIVFQKTTHLISPNLSGNGIFHFVVSDPLFYLPFFLIGAFIFKYKQLKMSFLNTSPTNLLWGIILMVIYIFNQQIFAGNFYHFEIDILVKMLLGLLMANILFSFGHILLNTPSFYINYLVNASLFIYLIHHPLTLIYGIFLTPYINNNILGFLLGIVFVFVCALVLYELQNRIHWLRFLFSGKK